MLPTMAESEPRASSSPLVASLTLVSSWVTWPSICPAMLRMASAREPISSPERTSQVAEKSCRATRWA